MAMDWIDMLLVRANRQEEKMEALAAVTDVLEFFHSWEHSLDEAIEMVSKHMAQIKEVEDASPARRLELHMRSKEFGHMEHGRLLHNIFGPVVWESEFGKRHRFPGGKIMGGE